MQTSQPDNELKEEQLLNFVVNNFEKEIPIDLGESVETTREKLYEVLAGVSRSRFLCPIRIEIAGSTVKSFEGTWGVISEIARPRRSSVAIGNTRQ